MLSAIRRSVTRSTAGPAGREATRACWNSRTAVGPNSRNVGPADARSSSTTWTSPASASMSRQSSVTVPDCQTPSRHRLRLVQERALPAELLAEFLDVDCAGRETRAGRDAGGGSCRLPGHPALWDLAHEGLGGGVAGHVAA